jgi:hypothetical protein
MHERWPILRQCSKKTGAQQEFDILAAFACRKPPGLGQRGQVGAGL